MVKRLTFAIIMAVFIKTGFGQTPPSTLNVVRYLNITATSVLDIASLPPQIDNRSTFSRHSDMNSFYATGTGSWSVTEEYADGSPSGYVSFGTTAVVTNSSASGIGYGIGYHDFIAFAITGNAIVNYSGTQQMYFPAAAAAISTPISVGQGGTAATVSTGWTTNLKYQSTGTGAVAETTQNKLGQIINVQDFGAVWDANSSGTSGTDNSTAIVNAYNLAVASGGTVRFARPSGQTGLLGIKQSLVFGTNGAGVPVTFDNDSSGSTGLVLLTGGTWSTYTSALDGASHTYGISFGPQPCSANTAYTMMTNFNVDGNSQVDTLFLNSCAEENSGLYNVLFTGCNFACIELAYAAFNSSYDKLDLFPNGSAYGIINACQLRCPVTNITASGGLGSGGVSTKFAIANVGAQGYYRSIHVEEMAGCITTLNTQSINYGDIDAEDVSCGPNISDSAISTPGLAAGGLSLKNVLMIDNASPGIVVKDYLNNWSGSGSGYSSFTDYGVGEYSSWKIGADAEFLASSNPSIPWIIPGPTLTATTLQATGSATSPYPHILFGYNGGVSNTTFGNWQAGFTNCGSTHDCYLVVGDEGVNINNHNQTNAGKPTGGGLSLSGNSNCGGTANPGVAQIGFGVSNSGGCSPVAQIATPFLIQANSGAAALVFTGDSGKTVGSTYSPTGRFAVTPYGPQNLELAASPPTTCAVGTAGLEWIDTNTTPYRVEKCLLTSAGVYNWYYYTVTLGP